MEPLRTVGHRPCSTRACPSCASGETPLSGPAAEPLVQYFSELTTSRLSTPTYPPFSMRSWGGGTPLSGPPRAPCMLSTPPDSAPHFTHHSLCAPGGTLLSGPPSAPRGLSTPPELVPRIPILPALLGRRLLADHPGTPMDSVPVWTEYPASPILPALLGGCP